MFYELKRVHKIEGGKRGFHHHATINVHLFHATIAGLIMQ